MSPINDIKQQLSEAIIYHQQGQLMIAKAMYAKILQQKPDHYEALQLLGVIAYQSEQYEQALKLFEKAITIRADYAEAWSNRGLALERLRQLDEAVASYDKAITIKTDYAQAWYNRGNALRIWGRLKEAIESYDKAIAIRPDYAQAHSNRGNVLLELNLLDQALESYEKAIAINPELAETFLNRGNALLELKQYAAAIESYDKAIAIRPDYAQAFYNRGKSWQALRQLEPAIASYDKAIAIRPDYAQAWYNKSLALLLSGNFMQGLELYEWRWQLPMFAPYKRTLHQKPWLGKESISGKTILLHCEQGLGDTIQFCRYAKVLADLGARVILEVQPPLLGLLQEIEGVSEVVAEGDNHPSVELHSSLMSLPLACRTEPDTIPSAHHYIRSQSDKVAEWECKLGKRTKGVRVGLVWSGSSWPKHSHERSIPLSELVQQLPGEFEYVSLQQEIRNIDRSTLESTPWIRHFGTDLKDFSDTAALCDLMDIVITIDTGVAHLSAAIGKQTLILLPFLPDWRWMLEGNKSPWYPTVTLFRQQTPDEWGSLIAEVVTTLRQLPSVQNTVSSSH
jgi:hypothetical protein